MRALLISAAMAALTIASPASAASVLNDTFNSENGGNTALSYTGFANFNVTNGNVDLVHSGDYGVVCEGGAGACVDLAGDTAGTITGKTSFSFNAGDTVSLSIDVSGNQRSGPANNVFADIIFAAPVSVTNRTSTWGGTFINYGNDPGLLTISDFDSKASGDPFTTETLTFTAQNAGSLTFDIGTNDVTNVGPVLDNVVLSVLSSATPEPATWGMMLLGFGMVGGALRRGKARPALRTA